MRHKISKAEHAFEEHRDAEVYAERSRSTKAKTAFSGIKKYKQLVASGQERR